MSFIIYEYNLIEVLSRNRKTELTPYFPSGCKTLIRTVSSDDKPLALAMQTLFLRVFGTIPAPVIIGTLIDQTCEVWQETESGTGSCFLYDNEKLVLAFLGFRKLIVRSDNKSYFTFQPLQ